MAAGVEDTTWCDPGLGAEAAPEPDGTGAAGSSRGAAMSPMFVFVCGGDPEERRRLRDLLERGGYGVAGVDGRRSVGDGAPSWDGRSIPVVVVEPLTPRESELVALLASGVVTDRGLAERLVVSLNTVKYHLHNVYRKLGVRSRTELLSRALRVKD